MLSNYYDYHRYNFEEKRFFIVKLHLNVMIFI